MPITPEELERFTSKTRQDGDCTVWTGPLDRDGYGTFHLRGKGRRVHRVAYFHAYGAIPKGYVVHHTCGNRACVNKDHLRLATVRENSLRESRSPAALNAMKVHCKNGHPFDRTYGGVRSCSICDAAKGKRLREARKLLPDPLAGC